MDRIVCILVILGILWFLIESITRPCEGHFKNFWDNYCVTDKKIESHDGIKDTEIETIRQIILKYR